jgi:hypothetical protein
MKKYILIGLTAICLLGATGSYAQEGPKATRKERKMEKKDTKMAKKESKGKEQRAYHKAKRADMKESKETKAVEKDK